MSNIPLSELSAWCNNCSSLTHGSCKQTKKGVSQGRYCSKKCFIEEHTSIGSFIHLSKDIFYDEKTNTKHKYYRDPAKRKKR